jgi:hypothetical protein
MHVKRLFAVIVLLTAGAASLLYGSLCHRVKVEVEKQREISIAVPALPGLEGMTFSRPGYAGPEGMPSGVKMEKATENYVEVEEEPEWTIVRETTIGGVTRLANGRLKRTYSGKPPALCPT